MTNRTKFVFDPGSVLIKSSSGKSEPLGAKTAAMIADAEQKANAILAEAQAQVDAVRQAAYNEGYQAGISQSAEEWQSRLQAIMDEREEVLGQLEQMNDNLEKQIMELAVQVAEKIVRHEVEVKQETVLDVLQLALRQVKDRANVKIWVSQHDLEAVRAARPEIDSWMDSLRNVDIGEDRRVEAGGVIIESSDGVFDARISSQLNEIHRHLQEAA